MLVCDWMDEKKSNTISALLYLNQVSDFQNCPTLSTKYWQSETIKLVIDYFLTIGTIMLGPKSVLQQKSRTAIYTGTRLVNNYTISWSYFTSLLLIYIWFSSFWLFRSTNCTCNKLWQYQTIRQCTRNTEITLTYMRSNLWKYKSKVLKVYKINIASQH